MYYFNPSKNSLAFSVAFNTGYSRAYDHCTCSLNINKTIKAHMCTACDMIRLDVKDDIILSQHIRNI